MKLKTFSALFVVFLITACNSTKPFYSLSEKNWKDKELPSSELKYSIYLLDGMGNNSDSSLMILEMLKSGLSARDTSHAIVFMSDHIDGKLEPGNKWVEFLKEDKGRLLFIEGGIAESKKGISLARKPDQFEEIFGKKEIFYPQKHCPGPDEIKVTNDIVLIPISTSWWLKEDEKEIKGCDVDDGNEWINEIKDVVDNNQRKNIIVLGHHPLLSVGNRGGFFSARQHIFPLTDVWRYAYLPLPAVGSLYQLIKAGIGTNEDLHHPRYKQMRRYLAASFIGYENLIYAAAHENNFQYMKYRGLDHIITNSGKQVDWTGKYRSSFTHSSRGLVKLLFLKNGEVWMETMVADKELAGGKVVFRKLLKDKIFENPSVETTLHPHEKVTDSVVTVIPNDELYATQLKTVFLGHNYRKAWTTPVQVPLIDLQSTKGGLEIVKKGGGFQTKALNLRDKKSEEYALRSVIKYPEQLLGERMKNTLAADVVKDMVSSNHPFAPYVVADLSTSSGILHNEPKMVFLPNDDQLAEYRKEFANMLVLFERRVDGNIAPSKNLSFITKAVSTKKLLNLQEESNENVIDAHLLLRSRLFDIIINDWDRHEKQWRWGEVECDDKNKERCLVLHANKHYYVPIPKDRDQALSRYQGILPWFAGRKWMLRKFQDFDEGIRDVPGLNYNGRNFDHAFLSELTLVEWDSIANDLKQDLTDKEIEDAVKVLPDSIYQHDGARMAHMLKARRDRINDFARKYYMFLSKLVDVRGSDMRELFEITRLNDEATSVQVFDFTGGNKGRLIYDRVLYTKETDEVRIYGFDGDDQFVISGDVKRGIIVRIIGGKGNDSIADQSHVRGLKKKTKFYDNEDEGNHVTDDGELRDLSSDRENINDYIYFNYKYDLLAPATFFGYNRDDGIFVGGGVVIKRHEFRKVPYASKQRIVANMSILDQSFNFRYNGDFIGLFGAWGINGEAYLLAPRSTTNYFGLGNETKKQKVEDDAYHRLRYDLAHFFPGLQRPAGKHHSIKFGPTYDYIKIEKTPGRFITSSEALPGLSSFDSRHFVGAKVEYRFELYHDSVLTFRGVKWFLSAASQSEPDNFENTSVNLESHLSLYLPVGGRSSIAIRTGGATRLGDYEFFQSNTLGGFNTRREPGNLRGLLRGRYSGRSVAFANTDYRLKLFRFKTYIFPAHIGVLAFYDTGRVWVKDEISKKWHSGYGGGIWIDPFGMTVVNLTYAISEEEKLFSIALGFLF